ncbi:unnamed protein product [Danaus chrysippus]|uniref:(African queen) hypothetical protein n=1 Tax=Danaus chrysippus TaxID=151541 RepID=A0A8J2R5N2_9NEOP|nr:unnamed protein product [Danaus chrysippus]
MSLEKIYSQMEIEPRQQVERYAEYPGMSHEQPVYYPYEPASGSHVPVVTKHHYSGGHKSNAAMSALTLLAFLFFLHILQQCLRDHMNAMGTPQVMVVGGRENERNIAKTNKIDKTNDQNYDYNNDDTDKYTKITTSDNAWKKTKYNVQKHYNNRSSYRYDPMDY